MDDLSSKQSLLNELARARALFQTRAILSAMEINPDMAAMKLEDQKPNDQEGS